MEQNEKEESRDKAAYVGITLKWLNSFIAKHFVSHASNVFVLLEIVRVNSRGWIDHYEKKLIDDKLEHATLFSW